jgi:hypothetical protein
MADRPSEVRYLNVDTTAIGQTLMVPGAVGYSVVLLSLCINSFANNQVTVEDGAGANRLGPYNLILLNNTLILPEAANGWFRGASGQSLQLLLTAAQRVVCSFSYRMIPDHFLY